ncbi:hypothetical protein BDD12DRAFT_880966 [Trichophaea hybrida]|nr:hypothetical protein BDD12DRAFT_880966 [Trichophaea hybrida]
MRKPFKIQFKEIEGDLQDQRDKIDLEIMVASETALLRERQKPPESAGAVASTDIELQLQRFVFKGSLSSSGSGLRETLLTAGIIDHIFSVCQGSAVSISYFFCDFANRQSLEICTILEGLIEQILNLFVDKISPALERELETAFIESPADPNPGKFLDECSDFDRRKLVSYLQRLAVNRFQGVKILCYFNTNSDIAAFIAQELEERIQQKILVVRYPAMIEEIQSVLVEGSEGMYLWVAFQLDDICRENNDEDIRRVLESLPRGLNETYGRILKRIVEDRKPEVAVKLFTWVATARRPLSLLELAEAIAFEPGDSH